MVHLFFSVEEKSQLGNQFNKLFPQQTKEAISEADYFCASNFFRWKGQVIDMGTPINWLHNPTGDKEYTWGINRFKHLRHLGIAYTSTGDERYAAKALEHIIGWIETQPCPRQLSEQELTYFQRPGPWRLLEAGLRLRQWVYAYHFFRGSESWTAAKEQQFLNSVKEHCWFLATYKASLEINHSIMHMIGLLSASLTFHSWPESEEWRQIAADRLEKCIRIQVLPDGVHTELTPHYHMVSLELFADCAYMMSIRGYTFSDEYEKILLEMTSYSSAMTRQDGMMAPFADSNACHPPDLNAAALYYNRPDLMLKSELHEQFWTFGAERIIQLMSDAECLEENDEQEEQLPFAFPIAGYYGMGNSQQKMIIDAAALGGPHGHADALSFEYYAFGETVFVDPGIYTYMENPWRRYFKSTAAHNTVMVDGQDQTPYLRTQRWGEPEAAVSLLAWDPEQQLLCAEHDGYKARGIIHRREIRLLETGEWLIFDQLMGTGVHTYQHRLHSRLLNWTVQEIKLAGSEAAEQSEMVVGFYAAGNNEQTSQIGCEVLLFGSNGMELDVEDSWESIKSMELEPLKVLQGLQTTEGGTWFLTVLSPYQGQPKLQPGQWNVILDKTGTPTLHVRGVGEHEQFVMSS